MRDPNRIDDFMIQFGVLWKRNFPDQRFGQLMLNFLGWGSVEHGDPFYWEEKDCMKYFEEFCNDRLNG